MLTKLTKLTQNPNTMIVLIMSMAVVVLMKEFMYAVSHATKNDTKITLTKKESRQN